MSIQARYFYNVDVQRKVLNDELMDESTTTVFSDIPANIWQDTGGLAEIYGQDVAEYLYGMSCNENDILEGDFVIEGTRIFEVKKVKKIRGSVKTTHHLSIDLRFLKNGTTS